MQCAYVPESSSPLCRIQHQKARSTGTCALVLLCCTVLQRDTAGWLSLLLAVSPSESQTVSLWWVGAVASRSLLILAIHTSFLFSSVSTLHLQPPILTSILLSLTSFLQLFGCVFVFGPLASFPALDCRHCCYPHSAASEQHRRLLCSSSRPYLRQRPTPTRAHMQAQAGRPVPS